MFGTVRGNIEQQFVYTRPHLLNTCAHNCSVSVALMNPYGAIKQGPIILSNTEALLTSTQSLC